MAFGAAGAVPIAYPTIVAVAPESWQPLDAALAGIDSYDWLIFTSRTAVASVLGRLARHRFPSIRALKIAAVGTRTAEAVEAGGGLVALVPEDSRQEGLAQALVNLLSGTRALLPIAAGGRTLLAETLRAGGCRVDVVTAYRTCAKSDLPPPPPFDVVTFASPSALRAFLAGPGRTALVDKTIAVIGLTTADEARAHGLAAVVAESPSVECLIRAIENAGLAKGDR
jgi:uroporphyrinogen-III synthase